MVDYRRDEGRPRNDEPAAPSRPETVKVPDELWLLVRKIAKSKRISKHAAYREAIDEYVEKYKSLADGIILELDE